MKTKQSRVQKLIDFYENKINNCANAALSDIEDISKDVFVPNKIEFFVRMRPRLLYKETNCALSNDNLK